MLGDAQGCEELRLVREDFGRGVSAIKFAQQTRNGFDDKRIGIADEEAGATSKLRHKP